jgi:hypothetical protein
MVQVHAHVKFDIRFEEFASQLHAMLAAAVLLRSNINFPPAAACAIANS